jgi:hypothetical protein
MGDNMEDNVLQEVSIAPGMKHCAGCGKPILRIADFCPHCGRRQSSLHVDSSSKASVIVTPIAGAAWPWKRALIVVTIVVVLFILGVAVVNLLRFSKDVQQSLVSKDVQGCMTELDGSTHCDFLRRTITGIDIDLRQCTKEELTAGKAPCWADQPAPSGLPPEQERIPVAQWLQVKVYLAKVNYTTKLSSCKAGFRCQIDNQWAMGPRFAMDKTVFPDVDATHRPMYIEQNYETYSDDEKSTIQAFCGQGFNILQDAPMHTNMLGDIPDPRADRSQAVSVCVTPPSPTANLPENTEVGPQVPAGQSAERTLDKEPPACPPGAARETGEDGSGYNWYECTLPKEEDGMKMCLESEGTGWSSTVHVPCSSRASTFTNHNHQFDDDPQLGQSASRTTVRDALFSWVRAFRSKDLTVLADSYAPLVERYFRRTNVSHEQIRQNIESGFAGVVDIRKYEINDVRVAMLPGDYPLNGINCTRATATFRKTWDTLDSNGKSFSGEEIEQLTFASSSQGWKIIREEELKILRVSKH